MSLALVPLVLFLLYASIQDVRGLAVERFTFWLWGTVTLAGWFSGAWPFTWSSALVCFFALWVAGTGRGDRLGGLFIGGLLGPMGGIAVALGLVLALLVCWRVRCSPNHIALYPFLSVGVAVMIGYQLVR